MNADKMKEETNKEIEFKKWRIEFWESHHSVPTLFDLMNDYKEGLET